MRDELVGEPDRVTMALKRGALTDTQALRRFEHIRRKLPATIEPETAQAIEQLMRSHDVLWSCLSDNRADS